MLRYRRYGIKKSVKRWFNRHFTKNFTRGVIVRKDEDEVHIDMYIIVSYGTKISEVAHNVQTKVKYTLDQTVGLAVDSVNIYVQGVKVINL